MAKRLNPVTNAYLTLLEWFSRLLICLAELIESIPAGAGRNRPAARQTLHEGAAAPGPMGPAGGHCAFGDPLEEGFDRPFPGPGRSPRAHDPHDSHDAYDAYDLDFPGTRAIDDWHDPCCGPFDNAPGPDEKN